MKPVWLLLSSPSFSSSAPSVASSRQYQRPLPALPIPEEESRRELQLSKRKLSLSLLLAFPCTPISIFFSVPSKAISDEDKQLALERYTDTSEGFTLLIPSSWIKVEKAGATVLFEQVNKGINNVGVVVTPVRLNSLGEFGTPQFVADKLIQAEKRKESTKNAEVIGVAERSGHGGLQVYEFEYKLDSTRGGLKRIFSAAFVASKRLYLLNIAYSDRPESPLDTSTKMMLEQVLHSFDVILQCRSLTIQFMRLFFQHQEIPTLCFFINWMFFFDIQLIKKLYDFISRCSYINIPDISIPQPSTYIPHELY